MVGIYSQSGQVTYGIKYYIVDTETEKDNLSTKDKIGCKCYVIENKTWYILNGNGQYVPFAAEGGAVNADAILSAIDNMTDAQKSEFRSNIGIGAVFTFIGTVATQVDLPNNNNHTGDIYYVEYDSSEYVWVVNESHENGYWEKLGTNVTAASVLAAMQTMTNTQAKSARTAIAAQTAIVNVVTDFGAVGDGTTDDAASIQSALDAGGVVYFPAKIYKIETALTFDSDTILFGEPGATILEGAALDNLMRNKAESTDGGYTATANVRIIGLTFDGSTYATDNTLLAFTHADSISIENCTFRNGYGAYHDIEVNSSRNVVIRGCSFNGSRRSGNNAEQIQLDTLTNRYTYPWGNEGAIDSTPCDNVTIEGCVFNVLTKVIGHHNSVAPKNTKFIGNMVIGSGDSAKGIVMPSADTLLVRDNIFSAVSIGIMCKTYVCYATITDNIFSGGTNGMVLSGGGNIVSGNTFTGLNRPVAIGAAQNVQTINDGNLITGNRADDCVNGFEGATSNGTSSGNISNGAYSGVFAMPPTVVTDAASASVTIATAEDNTIYECGEVTSLTVTAINNPGSFIIRFYSGATATLCTFPAGIIFPTSDGQFEGAEANTRYEINVVDGYALVGSWPYALVP